MPSRWAAGGILGGLRGESTHPDRRQVHALVGKEIEREERRVRPRRRQLEHSIGLIEQAITDEHAVLFNSTLPADKVAQLQALVEPAVEALGGEEVTSDYELETDEAAAPAEEAPAPAEEAAPVAAAAAAAPAEAKADDLTPLVGIGPKAASAPRRGRVTTFAALAEQNEPQLRRALHDADMAPPANVGTWPMQASLAAKGDWGVLNQVQQPGREVATRARSKAPVAAAAVQLSDDLTQLNGIGPRISTILNDGGITSYNQLAPREHQRPAPDHRHRRCAAAPRASSRGRPRPPTRRRATGPASATYNTPLTSASGRGTGDGAASRRGRSQDTDCSNVSCAPSPHGAGACVWAGRTARVARARG